jgi:hypothetical protein
MLKTSDTENPGPGYYNSPAAKNNVMLKFNPSWKMGSSTRNDMDKTNRRANNTPPPDAYRPLFTSTLS